MESQSQLQQKIKKDLMQQLAFAQSRPTCRQCWKYTDRKGGLQCYGHGGSDVGVDNDAGVASSGKSIASGDADGKGVSHELGEEASIDAVLADLSVSDQLAFLKNFVFDRGVISELLEMKLLVVTNDSEIGMLTIKLQCDPSRLSLEQQREFKKFVNAVVLQELEQFKKANGIKMDCCKIEKNKDSQIKAITISLPTAALYDAFIQRLANKNLLPLDVLQPQNATQNRHTPFSTQLSPATQKQLAEEELHANKRPSSIKSPLNTNGPKPKGFVG